MLFLLLLRDSFPPFDFSHGKSLLCHARGILLHLSTKTNIFQGDELYKAHNCCGVLVYSLIKLPRSNEIHQGKTKPSQYKYNSCPFLYTWRYKSLETLSVLRWLFKHDNSVKTYTFLRLKARLIGFYVLLKQKQTESGSCGILCRNTAIQCKRIL